MARARGRGRVHVYESLSDLQAIQFESRNKIQRPVTSDAQSASVADVPPPTVLGRSPSVPEDQ